MWLRRALVLEGTRGQPEDADLALYSRARLIWEENLSEPRAPTKMKLYIPNTIKRALHAKLHGHTEAAQRRRRERDLRKKKKVENGPDAHDIHACRGRVCRLGCAGELARQNRLQRQRLLDAEDMGLAAAADPRDLQTDRDESPTCAHTARLQCSAENDINSLLHLAH